jgi:hypothetical protein
MNLPAALCFFLASGLLWAAVALGYVSPVCAVVLVVLAVASIVAQRKAGCMTIASITAIDRIYAARERHAPAEYHGLLRICSWCKRTCVRGRWMYYVPSKGRERLTQTHGICPDCLEKQLKRKETK